MVEKFAEILTSETTLYVESILNTIKRAADLPISKSDGYCKACPVPWWNDKYQIIKTQKKEGRKANDQKSILENKVEWKRLQDLAKRLNN